MNKHSIKGIFFACVLIGLSGCTSQSKKDSPVQANQSQTPIKVTVTTEEPAANTSENSSELSGTHQAPDQLSCRSDNDCTAIPNPPEACIPCQGSATAINRQGAKEIMSGLKDTCMQKMKSKPQCSLMHGVCNNGVCVLDELTEDEMRAGQQQGQSQMGGRQMQGRQMQGQQGVGSGNGRQGFGFPGGGRFGGGQQQRSQYPSQPSGYGRGGPSYPGQSGGMGYGASPY